MKNLFNNLLLNSRFVFQNAGPEKPETPPPTPETGVEGAESKEASDATAGKQTEGAKEKGREGMQKTKDQVIRLEEVLIIGELPPEARKQFDKISKNLGEAPGPKAREIRVAKWEAQAKNNPDAQAALDVWKNIHSPAGAKLEQVAANTKQTVEKNEEHIARVEATNVYKEGLRLLTRLTIDNPRILDNIRNIPGNDKTMDNVVTAYNAKYDQLSQQKDWNSIKQLGKDVQTAVRNLGYVASQEAPRERDVRNQLSNLKRVVS